MSKPKILIVSHGHPDLNKGGAEVASYNLFQEYVEQGLDVTYLARTDRMPHPGTPFSVWKTDREILFHTQMTNFFTLKSGALSHLFKDFVELVKTINPTVVHFHHYIHIGIEAIRLIKNNLPKTKIIFTFHEYYAICHNSGQMVKNNSKDTKLCYKSSPAECSMCFPEKAPSDFFLREMYLKSFFNLVDHFISPSHFLIDRYVQWGLSAEKFSMIENGHPNGNKLPSRQLQKNTKRGRLAYFGQLNKFKGIDVLLEALLLINEEDKKDIHLDIFGANLELQPAEYQEKIKTLMESLGDMLSFHGKYESHELPHHLKNSDWVIVPSIWWENSPMVIQEVFNYGRPIIGSDIGGIREKIEYKGGLLFKNKDAVDLANTIIAGLSEEVWLKTTERITPPPSIKECAEQHLKIYQIDSI